MTINKYRFGYAIIAGILLSCFLLPIFYSPLSRLPRAETRIKIKDCYFIVHTLEKDEQMSVFELLKLETNVGSLNQKFVILANKHRAQLGLANGWYDSLKFSEVVDAWNNPLKMKWREEMIDPRYTLLRSNYDESLIIWSVGPNGIDEYGHGDDIIVILKGRESSRY